MITFGPDTVAVYPPAKTKNSVGGWDYEHPENPVAVKTGCTVQPLATEEGENQNINPFVLRCRGPWPWGSTTRIVWEGRAFDQDGEAKVHAIGRFTSHVEVHLLARSGVV